MPQGGGDVAVHGFDHRRVFIKKLFKAIVKIRQVIAGVNDVIEMIIEIFRDGKKVYEKIKNVTIHKNGTAAVKLDIDQELVKSGDLGDTCTMTIKAGNCVGGTCKTYDKVATSQKLAEFPPQIGGDPHMIGMLGQKFDWSGEDVGWYSLVSDGDAFQLNVRVTAPMPEEFPDRQLVSAVSILSPGGRSFVVEVKNPYTINTGGCGSRDDSSLPCLANGALRLIVDGVEQRGLQIPGQAVELPGDRFVSSANLPAECRRFGGDRIWAAQYADMIKSQRSLRGYEKEFEEWILQEDNMAAPTWCAKFLEEEGLPGLFATESNHAIFYVVTPTASLRINIGVNHQDRVTSEDGANVLVPELDFWQSDVGVERSRFSETVSGMLGETCRPVLNKHGLPIMEGIGSIRGSPVDYRVDGPYGVEFELLGHSSVSS